RTLGREKESGALALLVQLPYRVSTLIATKMAAIFAAWVAAVLCAASALPIWLALGGHLYVPETLDLVFGHVLYGVLIGAIALFSASIAESAATADHVAGCEGVSGAIGGRRGFTLESIVPLLDCTDWPDFVASACAAELTWLMRATA